MLPEDSTEGRERVLPGDSATETDIMLPGDSKEDVAGGLREDFPVHDILTNDIVSARAEGEGQEWWKADWTVGKGYGVDVPWAMEVMLEITTAVLKDWETKDDGAARGRKRPDRKYYKAFGRLLNSLANLQEVIFMMVEYAKAGKTRRI